MSTTDEKLEALAKRASEAIISPDRATSARLILPYMREAVALGRAEDAARVKGWIDGAVEGAVRAARAENRALIGQSMEALERAQPMVAALGSTKHLDEHNAALATMRAASDATENRKAA